MNCRTSSGSESFNLQRVNFKREVQIRSQSGRRCLVPNPDLSASSLPRPQCLIPTYTSVHNTIA